MTAEQLHLIWSNQHNAFWKPDGRGYTNQLAEAGRYTENELAVRLKWHEHREYMADGTPHEVVIDAPSDEDYAALAAAEQILDRTRIQIELADTTAIVERTGRQTKP